MEQMIFIKNDMENTLIKGVKKVSDKVYRFVAIYDRAWVEVLKYEPLHIIKGLETYVSLIKKDGMDYWEVFEGVTGVIVGYAFGGDKEKKNEAIKKATDQLTYLNEQGILIETLTKIANHITNGISPRYEGKLIDNNNRSGEIKVLSIGDSISIINLRGGLSYYTAKVESLQNVMRGGKKSIEYKFISNKNGYHFYKALGVDGCNSSFMYEPEFVELYEKANAEAIRDEVVINSTVATEPITENSQTTEVNSKILTIIKENISKSLPDLKRYNNWEDSVKNAAIKNADKEVPKVLTETDKFLLNNGFIRSYNEHFDSEKYQVVYFMPLSKSRKFFRLTCNGAMINNELKDRFEIRIMGPKFEGESLIYEEGIETLVEIVKQCLVAAGSNLTNDIQQGETEKVVERLETKDITIADTLKTDQIWSITPLELESDWLRRYEIVDSLLEPTRDEIEKIKEQSKALKGEAKKITQQKIDILKSEIAKVENKLNDEQEEINLNIRNLVFKRVKAKLGDILTEDINSLVSEAMMALSDDRPYREIYYNTTLENILNDLIVQYLEDKTKEVTVKKVYTLEEVAQLRINLSINKVQLEDITTLTNEEFALKRNAIWAMKNKAEALERNKDTPDYSYTSIFVSLYEILTKEERERTFEYIETLTDEQIKLFMTKWLSGEYTLEAYKEGGKGRVEEIIKGRCSSFSGGTLTAAYRFFIGNIQCQNKTITANIKHKIHGDTSMNYSKVTMDIKEATRRLIQYYDESLNDVASKSSTGNVNVEIEEVIKKETMKISIVELTINELEKICSKTKNKKQKSNLIEGQMMLAI